jgi:hypothetical protein
LGTGLGDRFGSLRGRSGSLKNTLAQGAAAVVTNRRPSSSPNQTGVETGVPSRRYVVRLRYLPGMLSGCPLPSCFSSRVTVIVNPSSSSIG